MVDDIQNKEKLIKLKETKINELKKDVAAKEKIVKDNEIERVKTQNEFTKKRIK